MAATMGDLESMSNADLREQCKIHGLPNVPVTDTSRKILIRKLKLVMDGPTPNDKDKSKRRETIHVVSKPVAKQQPEPEPQPVKKQLDTSRSARRTTIAATSSSISAENNISIAPEPPKSPGRRSSRHSSTSSEKKPVEVAPSKRKTAILEEENSDDDLIFIKAAEDAEKKQVTPSRAKATSSQESRDRRSRSASLQKSPTVTTSYKKDVPSTVHETEESETDNEILTQKAYKYDAGKPFVPSSIERETYYKSPAPLNVTGTRYSTLGTTSINKTNFTTAPTVTSGLGTSNVSRRYTTGYTTGTSHKYETYEDGNDDGEEVQIGGGSTPYYSDFARRLERLKNDQLNASGKNLNREYSMKRDIPGSRNYARRQDSQESNAFQKFCLDMDHKFKIKQKLYIILAVFLVLIIYIFIFH